MSDINNQIKDILHTRKSELDNLRHRSAVIDSRLNSFQEEFMNNLKKKCYESYIWFVKNGLVKEVMFGLEFEVTNPKERGNAKQKISEFDQCVTKHNLGISDFMKDYNIDESKNNYDKCTEKCVQENDFTECFNRCLSNYMNDLVKNFNHMENKIDHYRKKL
jgi:hypothetical protein